MGNKSNSGLPASMRGVRGVPLAQFMRTISPQSPSIPTGSAGLQQAKAQAVQQTGMTSEMVNQINNLAPGTGGLKKPF